jgi:hypothetical protein
MQSDGTPESGENYFILNSFVSCCFPYYPHNQICGPDFYTLYLPAENGGFDAIHYAASCASGVSIAVN